MDASLEIHRRLRSQTTKHPNCLHNHHLLLYWLMYWLSTSSPQFGPHPLRYLLENLRLGRVRCVLHERVPRVYAPADTSVHRHAAQQRYLLVLHFPFPPTAVERLDLVPAVGAYHIAHVFDHAQDGHLGLAE